MSRRIAKQAHALGSDKGIVYTDKEFVADTKRLTNKKGADRMCSFSRVVIGS